MSITPTKTSTTKGGNQRQPSRLQRRAPSSLQISPVSSWNVAIPLLSPVVPSPPSINRRMAERQEEPPRQEQLRQSQNKEPEKLVPKMWKHPAAPFRYDPAPLVLPFVPV
ncbi:hypothetical protein GQ457_09G020410 [Hibiscus cannabinus]